MEYQVYKQSTGELVAWIDTEAPDKIVIHKDYGVRAGENLQAIEDNEER